MSSCCDLSQLCAVKNHRLAFEQTLRCEFKQQVNAKIPLCQKVMNCDDKAEWIFESPSPSIALSDVMGRILAFDALQSALLW